MAMTLSEAYQILDNLFFPPMYSTIGREALAIVEAHEAQCAGHPDTTE